MRMVFQMHGIASLYCPSLFLLPPLPMHRSSLPDILDYDYLVVVSAENSPVFTVYYMLYTRA